MDDFPYNRISEDPGADQNCALRKAAQNGHAEIVRFLLGDERVDPSVNDNWAKKWASENGHTEVVRFL